MSPGAFALMLRRDYDRNLVLESNIFTDASFANDVIGVTGGSYHPLTQEMVEEMVKDSEKTRRFSLLTITDGPGMKSRLGARSLPDFAGTVRGACAKNDIDSSNLDFIGVVHIGNRAHYGLMDELGIDREKTVFLWDDGHCGHMDPLLALDYGIKDGIVKDGDLCALVGAGTGYVFGCSIVKWGKAQQ
ncbi:hypothetical protein AGMMS49983_21350 [Clostridia bacterium]|nr:hypothetical protein AGMMS49983_21350 [Clostridia bacterium]